MLADIMMEIAEQKLRITNGQRPNQRTVFVQMNRMLFEGLQLRPNQLSRHFTNGIIDPVLLEANATCLNRLKRLPFGRLFFA